MGSNSALTDPPMLLAPLVPRWPLSAPSGKCFMLPRMTSAAPRWVARNAASRDLPSSTMSTPPTDTG
eukprot:9966764-Alexandrium_andersonii.AAC.1